MLWALNYWRFGLKNFPHQYSDIAKLTAALSVARTVIESGLDFQDDGVFGEALAHAGVHTFRHPSATVAETLKEEKKKPASSQGFRTAARDMRRFLSLAGLISNDAGGASLTPLGLSIAQNAGNATLRNALWREAMFGMAIFDGAQASHPYRILVRLVSELPGIETRKLLLALEAVNDSEAEFERIKALASQELPQILSATGTSVASSRNAVKILPAIAEQLGDVVRNGPITLPATAALATEDFVGKESGDLPVASQDVTLAQIAADPVFGTGPVALLDLTAAIEIRKRRTLEHQAAVRSLAALLQSEHYVLAQHPFDCLGYRPGVGSVLIEMKTLDGSLIDERKQSERALGQIKGYAHFNVPSSRKAPKLAQVVAFTKPPTKITIDFLQANGLHSAWQTPAQWVVSSAAAPVPFSGNALLS